MQMRVIKLFGPQNLRLVDISAPEPSDGEILVRIEAAGICGTDRHLFNGEYPSTTGSTLGHEFSGIVVARGAKVNISEGTRVACDPNIWCGECDHCRRGRVNLCVGNIAIGIQRDGGFAEYCAFPAGKAHILPNDLHPHYGAFCEPLACTLHGIDLAAPQPGERVIVLGGGVIGMMAVQLARMAGAEVMLLTRNEGKRQLALQMGATTIAADETDACTQWPKGADIVIECAGVTETVEMSPRLTRTGGRVVILGVLPKGVKTEIDPFDLLTREIQLHFAFINPFTQARAARMIADGLIKIAPLISRVVSLEEAVNVIASPPPAGEIRCLVLPN